MVEEGIRGVRTGNPAGKLGAFAALGVWMIDVCFVCFYIFL
jgi:hypothetical protein